MSRITKALAGLTVLFAGGLTLAQSPASEHVPGRLLVQPVDHAPQWVVDQLLGLFGGKVHHKIDQLNVLVVDLPEPAIEHAVDALTKTGGFTFIERDFIADANATPNDPDFVSQWHLAKIQAASAWSLTLGSTSVPIAII